MDFENVQLGEHIYTMDLLDQIDLSQTQSTIEVLRVGKIHDRNLTITKEMLDDYVKNFQKGIYGTELQVNLGHDREGEAAAWIKDLFVEGDTLKAKVEWTPLGTEKVSTKQFRYISSELAPAYPDAKTGEKVKNVFIGCALTNVPAVKGMAPVSLSENLQLFLNFQSMKDLKAIHGKLMEKDKVTKEDMAEFNKQAAKYDEAENKEEVGKMKKALAAKMEKSEGEPDGDESEKKKKLSEMVESVSLTEFKAMQKRLELAEQQAAETAKANSDLAEVIARKELSEQLTSKFVLSEENTVGFKNDAETLEKVTNFLMSLDSAQRQTLLEEILPAIQHVDLSVHGSFGVKAQAKLKSEADVEKYADKITARAAALLSEKKASTIAEAQDMAIAEMSA